ncbi:MAG: flippase-like domain-containing protein [Proteobacteria bacterium]|nr:flippase-like domain-containing protein [Pseudomonadota bacterium]MBU2227799.1 flippase-like domain-containing protein [Pseudomonadota bacterium]MBU2262510.1 flippase-like domain-containing protein [Pseudomonadota bacterium]
MKKKVIAGLALGALLVYLSVRGIQLQEVAYGFRTIHYGYAIPVLAALFLMQVLRSFRWGLILNPLEKVDQLSLFSVTSVGFLAIIAIPARLGELARPYLITKKSRIPMSSALGTIFVERLLDTITILIIAVFVLFFTPLPPWVVRSGFLLLLLTLALFVLMFLLIVRRDSSLRVLGHLVGRLPARYADRIKRIISHFLEGFRIMADPVLLMSVAGLSIIIWLVDVLAIYLLFLAFDFQLPVAAAFVLMIILIIGIAIPAAPGFIGNWHYFCVLGLSIFGIPKTDALTFAIIYHFLSIGIVVVLGLIFLPFNRFSVSDLRRQARS